MNRQSIVPLFAALALGIVMSAVWSVSDAHQTGQTPPGQNTPEQIRRCNEQYAACIADKGCGPNSTAEQHAACERQCVNDSPALCLQYRRSAFAELRAQGPWTFAKLMLISAELNVLVAALR